MCDSESVRRESKDLYPCRNSQTLKSTPFLFWLNFQDNNAPALLGIYIRYDLLEDACSFVKDLVQKAVVIILFHSCAENHGKLNPTSEFTVHFDR